MWVFIYFAVTVAGHAVLCRLPLAGNIVMKFLIMGGLVGLALSGHETLVYGLAIETWTALLLYAFVCELYVFLFTLVSSSVSASLLLTLRAGSLTQAEIDRPYSSSSMVDGRVEKLLATRLLGMSLSGYVVTDEGRILLAALRTLRHFFRHTTPI